MRRLPASGDTTNHETSRPLTQPLNQIIASDEEEDVVLGGIPQQSARYVRQARGIDRPVTLGYSCLLFPMCFAAWWYWTRRKARRVIRLLQHASTNEGEEEEEDDSPINDDFSTWEEVVENETDDPSVRFVKWLNGGDSARRRASVNRATKRTMAKMSRANCNDSPLEERFQDEPESPKHSEWQCLHDAGGFELCNMVSAPSYDDLEKMDREQSTNTKYTNTTEPLWTPR